MPQYRHYHTNMSRVTRIGGDDSLGFIVFVPVVVVMFLLAVCCRVCRGQTARGEHISPEIPTVPPVEDSVFTLGNGEHSPESVSLQQRRSSLPGWVGQRNFLSEHGSVSIPSCSIDVEAQKSFTESQACSSSTPVEATPHEGPRSSSTPDEATPHAGPRFSSTPVEATLHAGPRSSSTPAEATFHAGPRSSSIKDTPKAHQSANIGETTKVHQSSVTGEPGFVAHHQPSVDDEVSDPAQIRVSCSAKSATSTSNKTSQACHPSGSTATTKCRRYDSPLARLVTFQNFSYKPLKN
nr:uncharacterized protein LOC123755565 [Procambarus clarkii]XP_045594280.1 uncharacterized protein LOC123755565 [Procambarus clarkii]